VPCVVLLVPCVLLLVPCVVLLVPCVVLLVPCVLLLVPCVVLLVPCVVLLAPCVVFGSGICDKLISYSVDSHRFCEFVCNLVTSKVMRPRPDLGRSIKVFMKAGP
jgi:hypothetical protein